ncbi:MAG: YgiT-type zinc finger protein [Bryobacteraceae bacterium]
MKCRICGGNMESAVTGLPFKIAGSIVVLKALPVLQFTQCADIELDDPVMRRVEQMLDCGTGGQDGFPTS